MILFFKTTKETVIAVEIDHQPKINEIEKLKWLFGEANVLET